MKVCIDDVLTVECSHLLNMGETWNGFVTPVFTLAQLAKVYDGAVANGWYAPRKTASGSRLYSEGSDVFLEDETKCIADDEYTVGAWGGWCWCIAEDLTCEDCGCGIYTEGCVC